MKPLSSRFTQNRIYICVCLVNFFCNFWLLSKQDTGKLANSIFSFFDPYHRKPKETKTSAVARCKNRNGSSKVLQQPLLDFSNDYSDSSILLRTNILPKKTFRIENTCLINLAFSFKHSYFL